jgi:hypothetical protein
MHSKENNFLDLDQEPVKTNPNQQKNKEKSLGTGLSYSKKGYRSTG